MWKYFQTHFKDWYLEHFLRKWCFISAIDWKINIGSGNDLVTSGNKKYLLQYWLCSGSQNCVTGPCNEWNDAVVQCRFHWSQTAMLMDVNKVLRNGAKKYLFFCVCFSWGQHLQCPYTFPLSVRMDLYKTRDGKAYSSAVTKFTGNF